MAERAAAKEFNDLSGEEKDLLRALIPKQVNECGSCSMCCTAPAIAPDDATMPMTAPKPAGEACQYCDVKGGCRVYNSRPEVCQDYYCLYSLGLSQFHPPEVGVAWTVQPVIGHVGKFVVTGHCLDTESVLSDARNLQEIASFFVELKVDAVVLRDPERGYQFCAFDQGDGEFIVASKQADIDPNDPLHSTILPETERHSPYGMAFKVEKVEKKAG